MRQESARKRSYQAGGQSSAEKYKPGFPMNLLQNVKIFYVIGAAVMIGSVIAAAVLTTGTNSSANPDIDPPTATPTLDPNATPSPTPAPDPKQFAAAEDVVDEANKEYRAIVKTSAGDFEIELFADRAPNTVNNFVFLAQKDFYDGIVIHRVRENFVVQAGDPKGDGSGGAVYPGYQTQEEPNEISNTRGTVSMAKVAGATTFGSQFFVNVKDNTALDYNNTAGDKFYPFGEVVRGMDVLDEISRVETDARDKPVQDIVIEDVEIVETDRSPGAAATGTASATATPGNSASPAGQLFGPSREAGEDFSRLFWFTLQVGAAHVDRLHEAPARGKVPAEPHLRISLAGCDFEHPPAVGIVGRRDLSRPARQPGESGDRLRLRGRARSRSRGRHSHFRTREFRRGRWRAGRTACRSRFRASS